MGAVEVIVTLIAGGIVAWSLVVRYQTINSPEFIENTRVTVGVFFAFVIGFIMLYPNGGEKLPRGFTQHWIFLIFIASPLFIFPIFKVLKGESLSQAFYRFHSRIFDSIRYNIGDITYRLVIVIAIICIFPPVLAIFDTSIWYSLSHTFGWIIPRLFFVSFAVFLGFIHSLFGTIIAGINIAMVLAHFFLEGTFGASLGSVFDFFEMVGISSMPMKWTIIFISTLLGIHSAMSFDDMKDLIQNGLF